jgi:hypothetical protein
VAGLIADTVLGTMPWITVASSALTVLSGLFVLPWLRGLRVSVTTSDILLQYGWFRKRIALTSIQRVGLVPVSLLAGWGIRWLGHRRWLWRAAGRVAVELSLDDGSALLIGIDDHDAVMKVIQGAMDRPVTGHSHPFAL